MTVRHILIDDQNSLHRELPIYRTGQVGAVRLSDGEYKVYDSLEINARDYAALFHYGVIELLNALPFISESKNGLDSWDEAFLASANIEAMTGILDKSIENIAGKSPERIMLGWQDDPEPVAYWREIDPASTLDLLRNLRDFAAKATAKSYDLEFIL
ncbi:hypothetical protein FGF66_11335 [Chlorobaculum thiosulfatiphilum]|jgi:hypothetical protein|uniref:Uncharacterized protein n=1 Tax=Chlorobaculum thiosulfatiphilum TaxID=115852 RepID=A0A5C4S097_CHLTI|nr:hypothetical protein [Chlorobaculum thiosulfatiphilum]TNJ36814.1 hypothetical protein FGF66_11335 [Chlorobaculum thiosulfatiphilum]